MFWKKKSLKTFGLDIELLLNIYIRWTVSATTLKTFIIVVFNIKKCNIT